MRPRVLCLLVDGFEEIEAVTPIDLLRRAGVEVVIASLDRIDVTGRGNLRMIADMLLKNTLPDSFDLLLLPGGPGVTAMRGDARAAAIASIFQTSGKKVAAICAAPLILKDAGILTGRRFTGHAAIASELPEADFSERVIVDDNLITSRGAGTALDFGLALVTALCGQEKADEIAASIHA
jgi:protein deglycase